VKIGSQDRVYYDESIYVGYRYYQTFNRPVAYPFGYGLSYTTFAYQNLKVSKRILADELEVTCQVKNTGAISGKVVVQLYIENNSSSVYKPKRELRQFQKIKLEPGEEQVVTFHLTTEDFSYYDSLVHDFICNAGEYKIQICEHANHVLLEELIAVWKKIHVLRIYHAPVITKSNMHTSDFSVIYGAPLPKLMMHRRPFTMDSTLKQLRASLLGIIIGSVIIRMAKQKASATDVEWMKKTI
jgi:beta-glucosidase